jgi:DNA-binding transcriptional regulator YiaG
MTHPLTKFRNAENMSLEMLANKIGASKSMVWKWENHLAEPRPAYREKIVTLTGGKVSVLDLLIPPKVEPAE